MNKTQKKIGRISGKWIGILLAALTAAVILAVVLFTGKGKEKAIFFVDGQPVYREEAACVVNKIKLYQREKVAAMARIDISEFTWDIEVDEKTGYEYLADAVVEELKQIKAMQKEAMDNGLVEAIDYPLLMKEMDTENQGREEKKGNNETVFGVVQYSADQFYDYFNENLSIQNKRELEKREVLTVSDEEARAAYDADLEYFDNEEYENVKTSAKNLVLEKKYREHLKKLGRDAGVEISNQEVLLQAVKDAVEGK